MDTSKPIEPSVPPSAVPASRLLSFARFHMGSGGLLLTVAFFLPMVGGCFRISPMTAVINHAHRAWL
ncbi:MAG: hypothetical protein M5U26_08800 [Planctomycetota bacterium]|nr:hypothetical protein [Planctomycetota bacterium]